MNLPSPTTGPSSALDDELIDLIRQVPAHATVKGMYLDTLMTARKRAGLRNDARKYITFKDYPLVELMDLLIDTVPRLYPNVPVKAGLRLFGQTVYPTLATTTVGKVIFSVAGSNFERAVNLSAKAYDVSIHPCKLTPVHEGPGRVRIEMRDLWNFPKYYQVGVFEGAMKAFGVIGTVRCEALSRPCDVNLHLEWKD